ncbi:YlxR family protein [Geodermatophilus sp. YIM 151500]|uniref:YlxR family protein n=1 Tax=Geodermatophilus sp. YIM 151500 TaxID=2984531 RepID=UPI0021E41EA3|nr:YlxR family protein [Geodermatophilus sp. YIM 151500]MCV2488994.1 YlxR family protein [Geodermatophilus sp. YIM 151500]
MGCRTRAPVTDLLRVVVRDGVLVPDPRRRLPGRGASLHPTPECLHAAERRRAFSRALRTSAPLEAGPLRSHVLGPPAAAPGDAGSGAGDSTRTTDRRSRVGPAPGRTARREQDVVG